VTCLHPGLLHAECTRAANVRSGNLMLLSRRQRRRGPSWPADGGGQLAAVHTGVRELAALRDPAEGAPTPSNVSQWSHRRSLYL